MNRLNKEHGSGRSYEIFRISFGSLKNQPLRAVECLGDPMMAAAAGLVDGLGTK